MILALVLFFSVFAFCSIYSYYKDRADEKWQKEHPDVILPGKE